MFEALLTTTKSEGLQPLGSAAQRSFELVTGTLRARLGEAHANLFAEPVATQHGDSIDWYAPMRGAAVPLPDLPTEDRQQVRDALAPLVAGIKAEAETLATSPAADDQRLSEALLNAIEVPDEAMIYGLRDEAGALHPLLVHWAWVRDEQRAVRGVLTGMIPRPVDPSALQAVEPPARRAVPRWLWWLLILLGWLLLAVLLGWLLFLLIAPCGLNQGRIIFCPEPPPPALSLAEAERKVIEDEIAAVERDLALLDRNCQPTVPAGTPASPAVPDTTPPAPGSPPAPEDSDEAREDASRRAVERGAERGDLNFALEWTTKDDIDLYVTCPSGAEISYRTRRACGGVYDLDANVRRQDAIENPVENIVFNDPPPGVYTVRVHLRGERTDGDKPFALHVLRKDAQSQTFTGKLNSDRQEWTTRVRIEE